MTERAIPDLAERERALDPAASFIVQAPAGSGKTELLIQRFLVLLARVERPEEIAAITFTRKAAAEMRKRIFEALATARRDPRPAQAHEARTWDLGKAVLDRNDALGWCLEESAARLRVQTIDSLCVSLTRQMPILSRFGAQPESVDDASLLYLEAARETLALVEERDEIAADVARVLSHLDNNRVRSEKLIADLLQRRDHWLRYLRGADDRAALEAVLADICRIATERARGLFPAGGAYALPPVDDIEAWRQLVEQYVTKKGTWREKPSPAPRELVAHDDLLQALCLLRSLPRPRYSEEQWEVLGAILRLARIAVGQLKLAFAAHGQADFTEIAQGALRALETEEGPTDLLLALDYSIRHILVDEFQDTSFTQFELLRKLTSGWSAGDGRTLFVVGDPMQSIYRFREAEVGLFLRARREGIGAVALEPLTLSANFRSQAGIVDWVNATFARVMPEQEDIGLGAVRYAPSLAVHDGLPDAVTIHPFFNGDRSGEAAAVAELAKAALEAPGLEPEKPSTVAILVRNRSHLLEIVPQLRAAGLAFRAIEIERLSHRPLVQDLLALTRALAHVGDRTAWLAVLRAPWCGVSLEDLWKLAGIDAVEMPQGAGAQRFEIETIWETITDEARVASLSPEGERRVARLRAAFEPGLRNRRRRSLRDAVEGTWLALGGPACVEDLAELEDAESYLDHLGKAEEGGALPHVERFEMSLQKLYAAPDAHASDRLQVMTIHKAKGLEFDTVIVPGLGSGARADERKLFVWMERPTQGAKEAIELQFLLSPINAAGSDADPTYELIRALDKEKDAIQDARLLYVAATRARKTHHLLGDVKRDDTMVPAQLSAPRKEAMLHHLWPQVEERFAAAPGAAAPLAARGEMALGAVDEHVRLKEDVADVAAPSAFEWRAEPLEQGSEEQIEFSWVGEASRHAGSVVHRWLQRIGEDGMKGWTRQRVEGLRSAVRHELAARGIGERDLDASVARVIAALAASLEDPRGQWLLGPHDDAHTEYRLSAIVGGERRMLVIDRMFTDAAGKRWIVDYKTSAHEGADLESFLDRELVRYTPQLCGYASAFADAGVGLGLYFPLVKGWREIS